MKVLMLLGKRTNQIAAALPFSCLLAGLGMVAPAAAVTVDTPATDTVPNGIQIAPAPLATENTTPKYSAGFQDVLKMLDAKVNAEVIKEYIKNSPTGYDLSAGEIVALKKRGVADEIVIALLQRGAEVRAQAATPPSTARPSYSTQPPYAPNAPAPYGSGEYGYDYGDYNPYYSAAYAYPYDYSYGYPYNYWWYNYSYPWWGYWPFYYVDAHGHHHYYHHGHYDGHSNGHYGNWHSGDFHGGHNSGSPNQTRSPFGTYTPNRAGYAGTGARSPFGTYMPQRAVSQRAVSRPAVNFGSRPMAYSGRSASFSGRPASFGGHAGGMRVGGGSTGRAGGGGHR